MGTYFDLLKQRQNLVAPETTKKVSAFDALKQRQDSIVSQEQPQLDENNILQSAFVSLIGRPAIRASQALVGAGVEAFGSEQIKQNFNKAANQPVKLPMGLGTVEPQKGFEQGGVKQIVGNAAETATYLAPYGKIAGAAEKVIAPTLAKSTIPFISKTIPKLAGEAVAGAVGGYGFDIKSNAEQDKPLFKPGMSTVFGAGLGVVAPPVIGAVANKIRGVLPEQLNKYIDDLYPKAIPSTSKSKLALNTKQVENNRESLKIILDNKPKLEYKTSDGMVYDSGRLPKNLTEHAQAVSQTQQDLWNKQVSLLENAKAKIFLSDPIKKIEAKINELGPASAQTPALQNYLNRYKQAEVATPKQLDNFIADLNNDAKPFFQSGSDAPKAQAAMSIGNLFREQLDKTAQQLGIPEVSLLRRQYGALSSVEKDVVRALTKQSKGASAGGVSRLSDLFSGEEITRGVLTLNPQAIISGASLQAVKKTLTWMRDPDRYLRKLYSTLDKTITNATKKGVEVPRMKTPYAPQEKAGLPLIVPKQRGNLNTAKPIEPIITPSPTTYEKPAQKIGYSGKNISNKANTINPPIDKINIPSIVPQSNLKVKVVKVDGGVGKMYGTNPNKKILPKTKDTISKETDNFLKNWVKGGSKIDSKTLKSVEMDLTSYKPTKPVKLYRGTNPSGKEAGPISWTYNKEAAQMHAGESGGKVVSRKVSPDEILVDSTQLPDKLLNKYGFIDEESEVLLKPNKKSGKTIIGSLLGGAGVSTAAAISQIPSKQTYTKKESTPLPKEKDVYEKMNNQIHPKFIDALVQQESSGGTNDINKDKDQGEFGWVVGFTKPTYKDIKKKAQTSERWNNLFKKLNFDTEENAKKSAMTYVQFLMRDFSDGKDGTTPKKIGATELYKLYNGGGSPKGVQLFDKIFNSLTK